MPVPDSTIANLPSEETTPANGDFLVIDDGTGAKKMSADKVAIVPAVAALRTAAEATAAAALAAHVAAGDPHPTYLTQAEGNALYEGVGAAAAVQSNLGAHLADPTDAHDASAISVVPFSTVAATDVQTALEEIVAEVAAGSAVLSVNTETGAVVLDAGDIDVADAGGVISGATVEAGLQEVATGQALVNVVAATGATETLTLAPVHRLTMDQNCELTFPTPTLAHHSFELHLLGAFTPTFPTSVDWPNATPPTYAATSVYVFTTSDAGTTWYGVMVGSGFG